VKKNSVGGSRERAGAARAGVEGGSCAAADPLLGREILAEKSHFFFDPNDPKDPRFTIMSFGGITRECPKLIHTKLSSTIDHTFQRSLDNADKSGLWFENTTMLGHFMVT